MKYSFANGLLIQYHKDCWAVLEHRKDCPDTCRVLLKYRKSGSENTFSTKWYKPTKEEYDLHGDGVFDRILGNLIIGLVLSVSHHDGTSWYKRFMHEISHRHFGKQNMNGSFR